MEKDGLLLRIIQRNDTVQVKYVLTRNGYNIIPVIDELVRWGHTYKNVIPAKQPDKTTV